MYTTYVYVNRFKIDVRAACMQQGPGYILDLYPKGDLCIHKNIQTHKHTHTHEHIQVPPDYTECKVRAR